MGSASIQIKYHRSTSPGNIPGIVNLYLAQGKELRT